MMLLLFYIFRVREKVKKESREAMGGSGGPPQSIHGESENIKSLGGSFPCHP
jgi:hypothetical protein